MFLEKKNLDAAIIYGAPNTDVDILTWVTGNQCTYPTYLIVTPDRLIQIGIRWLEEDLKAQKTIDEVVTTSDPVEYGNAINKVVRGMKNIGLAGSPVYSDIKDFGERTIEIENDLLELSMVKTSLEIKAIKASCNLQKIILQSTEIKPGHTENEIASSIDYKMRIKNATNSYPTSVISGSRLKLTTFGAPTLRKIGKGDIVCIDSGPRLNNYRCDITRCYAVGKADLKPYNILSEAVKSVASKLTPGKTSRDALKLMKAELDKNKLGKYLIPIDMGHGIGVTLHEPPAVGEDDFVFQSGMTITLEPELLLPNGRVRREDVVCITKNGGKILSNFD